MEHCLKIVADRDDFSVVIFSDECTVKIERSTRECVLNGTRERVLS